jgi:acetylxylan esterase
MILSAATLLLPLILAIASVEAQSTGDSTCQEVHLFLARGDGEEYSGRIGALATATCADIDNCDAEDIVFTSVDGSIYCDSLAEGVSNGIKQITAYNLKCPDTILVVAGYSLGAHLVGDVLGGGGGTFYNCAEGTVTGNLNPSTAPGNMSESS